MSTTDDAPDSGYDSEEIGREAFPFREESDEGLALVLEGQKQEAMAAVNDVTRALLNDEEPLTDGKVQRVKDAAHALRALSDTVSLRVPEEHQESPSDDADGS